MEVILVFFILAIIVALVAIMFIAGGDSRRKPRRKYHRKVDPPAEPKRIPTRRNENTIHVRDIINRKDVYLIDTETSGLTENSVIVEAAVCDMMGEIVYHSYYQLPKGARFQEDATQVNGLTRERLKELNAKPFDEEWPKLEGVLRRAAIILSWNAEFEIRLLDQTQDKWGVKTDWGDTIYDAQKAFGYRAALHRTAQSVGVSYSEKEAHTARGDIRILLEVLRAAASGKVPSRVSDPPTDRQIEYIESLAEELGIAVNLPETKPEASRLIDDLKRRRGF